MTIQEPQFSPTLYCVWSDKSAHFIGPTYFNSEAAIHYANHIASQPYHINHRTRVIKVTGSHEQEIYSA